MTSCRLSSRRRFLETLGLLFASSAGLNLLEGYPSAAEQAAKYKLAPWTGDDFSLGHRMRDGVFPTFPRFVERTVDFVIVGGGMAGLAAGHYLRNHDFLLLEQYDEPGGQSRGRRYKEIDYSFGAAYMGSNEGAPGELISEMGLKPVAIPPVKNSWYWQNKWLPGISGDNQSLIYSQFDRLISECRSIWKQLPPWQRQSVLDMPGLSRLDSIPFSNYLHNYDPAFITLLDKFCLSSLGGGVNIISALAGFYMMQDLASPSYVFKGGNPALARALAQSLNKGGSGRLLTGTFVWNISNKDGRAEVIYSTRDGSMHRVGCRAAIVTAPPLVAARIATDLNDKVKALLLWQKYSSYLVANFCLLKKVFNGSYDNWAGAPFTFADVIVAETPYELTGSYKPEMGSVLTVYQPYPPASAGRAILLAGNRQELASQLIEQLSRLVEQFQGNLDEVVLSRWGHAMVVPVPGFFNKLASLQALDAAPIFLAHNSTQGLPCAESAINAARNAVARALAG